MITTRFAPSPTGHLHLGHAAIALAAFDHATRHNGQCLLRIEDIDTARCRPAYISAIIQDLTWLGISWPHPPRIQSNHLPDYRRTLDRLTAMNLLYPCFCTRAEIAAALGAPHGEPQPYRGTCRTLDPAIRADRLAQNHPYALRLDTNQATSRAGPLRYHEANDGWCDADPTPHGDVILARKDTPASYHLCVTHDDALQSVTLIHRGNDLRPATSIHLLLQRLLDWPTPAYAHHPLLTDSAGRRLAKRDRATTLHDLRTQGATPNDIRKMISCRIANLASLSQP